MYSRPLPKKKSGGGCTQATFSDELQNDVVWKKKKIDVQFDWLKYNVWAPSYKNCIFVWQKLRRANN